jgi:hypothetical protein
MTDKPGEPRDPTDTSHLLYDPTEDPTHPFYEGDKMEAEQKPDPADEDTYKVGPGRPPKQYTWKPGGPSPHPTGRPKKVLSMKPDLKKALEAALNEKVVITKDKKEIVLTKAALGIQQLVNQFAKGDRHARRDLFQYALSWVLICRPRMSSRRRSGSTIRRSSMPPSCDVSSSPPRARRRRTMSRHHPT